MRFVKGTKGDHICNSRSITQEILEGTRNTEVKSVSGRIAESHEETLDDETITVYPICIERG